MRDRSSDIERLAELLVGFGANLQPGQIVGVTAYLGMEDARPRRRAGGYKRGAKYVDVVWWDQLVKRERLEHADEDTLEFVPPWLGQRMQWLSDERAARIRLTGASAPSSTASTQPHGSRPAAVHLRGAAGRQRADDELDRRAVPEPRLGQARPPRAGAGGGARQALGRGRPHLRLDTDDPVAAWHERMEAIVASADRLTERRFDAIHLQGPGTDVTIGLLPSSTWLGADFTTVDGLTHYPNLPTEEVFTTPDPSGSTATSSATMPLEMYGSFMDGIRIEFGGGRAVKIDADGAPTRCAPRCAKDDGASRLGELALVDGEGRIGPLDTVFHDTLIDENAASHIALGNAYTLPGRGRGRPRAGQRQRHPRRLHDRQQRARRRRHHPRRRPRARVLRGGAWQI